ncbi:MAG: poly(A) polymerase [Thermodesulfobacteriota bacterium]
MTPPTLPEPRIIPRSEHPISRANIDREALKVMYRLRDAGHRAYLVGGGVRDLMLGRTPKDFDISTDAHPGELRKLFRNSRIIGKRFRLVQVFYHGGKIIEVSTFRCRSEFEENGGDAVLAQNNTFGTPAEDAFRRDLTINALFYEIENFTVIDYTGGVADLHNRIVRMVGDPERRITRDPVRMLRAIRHAARQGFTVEGETWAAIRANADKLALCPVSRIRDEFMKDLRSGAMREWAKLALASTLFFAILPCYAQRLPGGEDPGFYGRPEAQGNETLALLFRVLDMVDRFCTEGTAVPDEVLFALLLLPWAIAEFDLLRPREQKGGEGYRFTRRLREALDVNLEHLGIKRASKEEITLLLSSLPLFVQHEKDGEWPRWLARKSYFQQALTFYRLYQAAAAGAALPEIAAPEPAPPKAKRRRGGGHRRGARTTAFATTKGGIFGLKK